MSFLKNIKKTSVNFAVLAISIGVFVCSFLTMTGIANSQKPPTRQVMAATRNLEIGDIITPQDITAKTVYEDELTDLYIPVDQGAEAVGGYVAIPISAGHPIPRTAIIAPSGESNRFSAVLSKYPDHSLFPLPLDAMNVVSPDASYFKPGDLVSLTVVIGSRPQEFATPQVEEQIPVVTPTLSPESIMATLTAYEARKTKTPEEAALERARPPMSKDIIPAGVRVIAVQGLAPDTTSEDTSAVGVGLAGAMQPQMLILLVPNQYREELGLALQQGDLLIVSLLARGGEEITPGFTYWDLEEQIKEERAGVLGTNATSQPDASVPPAPSPAEETTPTPTPPAEGLPIEAEGSPSVMTTPTPAP